MPPNAYKRPLKAVTPSSTLTKRTKQTFGLVIADTLEWPSHDMFWDIVSNCASEVFMKKQKILEEYNTAIKVFFGYLSLPVCSLYQDQLIVIFCATLPNWYQVQ